MPKSKEQFQTIKDNRKNKLLSVSLNLFANKGFDKVSIVDITSKAKCAHGLFYHYFSSTEEVLKIILENSKFSSLISIENNDDPVEVLDNFCDGFYALLKSKKTESILMTKNRLEIHEAKTLKDPSIIKKYAYFPLLKKTIKLAQLDPKMIQINPEQLAASLTYMCSGALDAKIRQGNDFKPLSKDAIRSILFVPGVF